MRGARFAAAVAAASLAGCTVGPNYQRPKVAVPASFRGPEAAAAAASPADTAASPADVASLGDAKWWTIFRDPALQQLIRTALDQSYDLRIAATRVLEARSQVTITRSNEFPTIAANPLVTGQRTPAIPGGFPAFSFEAIEAAFSVSWDFDFWGKYRRATEEARANLLAADWGRKAVIGSLVANVAAAYFQLRELDLQLEISRRTLAARQDSLKLTQTLADGGAASLVDVRQAEQLVETASAAIPDLERQIQQQENQIAILLGQNPETIARGVPLTEQPLPEEVPAGVPSRLLERRPDVREAEQRLIAANANIGVARAAFFPDISLTALGGVESSSLATLFRASTRAWNWTGQATEPIFNAGRIRADYRLAQQQEQEALLTYQQTIQKAFGDVSNALIAYRKFREEREHQEKLVTAAKGAADLSRLRYEGGAASYLEVLTNDSNAFSAELNLAAVRLAENAALIQIYNSLGGGWEQ